MSFPTPETIRKIEKSNPVKRVVLLAPASDLGRLLLQRLLEIGFEVVLLCEDNESREMYTDRCASFWSLNLRSTEILTKAVDFFVQALEGHHPDMLICCHECSRHAITLEASSEEFDNNFTFRLRSLVDFCRIVANKHLKSPGGSISIVCVEGDFDSSVDALEDLAQGAALSIVSGLDEEFRERKIRVNGINVKGFGYKVRAAEAIHRANSAIDLMFDLVSSVETGGHIHEVVVPAYLLRSCVVG